MTSEATFAAGCFWQVEIDFANTPGVLSTEVGYTGGASESPSYEQVCGGGTGHAEAVHLTFDSDEVSYEELLRVFFGLHDPTQLNRQGPDVGHQYRSVVFAHGDEQAQAAQRVLERTQESYSQPVVTEIEPAKPFWRAEEYHQCYLEKRGTVSGLFGQLLGR